MDVELKESTNSPSINYFFTDDLLENYEYLIKEFNNGTEIIQDDTGRWRDDMKFLFHLTKSYRFYVENKYFPMVKFQKIPNISNARWNSRAILAILAYILIPNTRKKLKSVCDFISYDWADHWFDDQMFKESCYENLMKAVSNYVKALNCFKTHWSPDPSPILIPRSNQCAERAIKVMEEFYASCKNKENVPLRFILSNKQ